MSRAQGKTLDSATRLHGVFHQGDEFFARDFELFALRSVKQQVDMFAKHDKPKSWQCPDLKIAVYTTTTRSGPATWQSAVAFYSSCGFVPVKVENGDQHYRLVIVD